MVSAQAQTIVRLATSIVPPYQQLRDNRLEGKSLELLQCVFDQLPQFSMAATVLPWKRAIASAHHQQTDGWFLYLPGTEQDAVAEFSVPLALEKWMLFRHADTRPRSLNQLKSMRLGVVAGGYQQAWLRKQGFGRLHELPNSESLMRSFEGRRFRYLLMDETAFSIQIAALRIDPKQFVGEFVGYMPLGVYFSRHFLQQHPKFLPRFNAAVPACRTDSLQLTESDRARLTRIAHLASEWRQNPLLINAVLQQNQAHAGLSQPAIDALDQRWRRERQRNGTDASTRIHPVLNTPASLFLQQQQAASAGVLMEIFIMDNKGLNVAQSKVTSDYWQGDEDKYLQVFPWGRDLFIGRIEYDESTRTFQAQISLLLRHPDSGEKIGVLTLGVNVEKALAAF
jgi:hypothetical protein